jgi:hypothetical protein
MSRSPRPLLTPASTLQWLRESNDLLVELTLALATSGGNSERRPAERKTARKPPRPTSPPSTAANPKSAASTRTKPGKGKSQPRKSGKAKPAS